MNQTRNAPVTDLVKLLLYSNKNRLKQEQLQAVTTLNFFITKYGKK